MIKLGYRSLGMRIWVTITVIILVMTISISLIYTVMMSNYVAQRKAIENAKNTKTALLTIKNPSGAALGKVESFIVKKGKSGLMDIVSPEPWDKAGLRRITPDLRRAMAEYIKVGEVVDSAYVINYNGRVYEFTVGSIGGLGTDSLYLISYTLVDKSSKFLGITILVSSIFIIIGLIVSNLVAENISKPLAELENYTTRIANKDWTKPLEIDRKDELGRLAAAMNIMQEELKKKDEDEKIFFQSISHDLKTPVMVIMSHAEALIDGIYVDSAEETAFIIREEALRLERKISQILYLNSLEYSLEKGSEVTEINLEELVIGITAKMKHIRNTIKWKLDTDEVIVLGNAEKLRVAIENILDNQLRYAKEYIGISLRRGDIEVDLPSQGMGKFIVTLEIYNDGPVIEEELSESIFEPFYKGKKGNFGLGLAISKRIIEHYKGTITAESKERGASFIIKMPVVPEV